MRWPGILGWTAAALLLAGAATAASLSVAVRDGALRETPSPFGRVLTTLSYGERVETLSRQGAWTRVRSAAGKSGWMHGSALTERKLVLQAGKGQPRAAASEQELTLAGKGFSTQVEAEYRRQNTGLNYAAVDRMEQIDVGSGEMLRFLSDGRLRAAGGKP